MAWLRWDGPGSPLMPEAERDVAITAFLTKVITNNPPAARVNLKAFLMDVAKIVEIERNEIDQSGVHFDPEERFAIKRRIHNACLVAGVIRNFRLARVEFEDAFIEMWHDD